MKTDILDDELFFLYKCKIELGMKWWVITEQTQETD